MAEEHIRLRNHNEWAESFLIQSIVAAQQAGIIKDVPTIPEGGLKVTLIINGVECPVIKTLEYMAEKHDEVIKRAALRYVEENLSELTIPLWNLLRDLEETMKQKIKTAGLELETDA